MEKLKITSFKKTLDSLKSILERYSRENDADIRDEVIQKFEYTYSLAIKMIIRFINYQLNKNFKNNIKDTFVIFN